MTYALPIEITEIPHRGKPTTWTLHDEAHLKLAIDAAYNRGSYDQWMEDNGYLVFEEKDDEFVATKDESRTLDAYLAWLGHDLSRIDVREIS